MLIALADIALGLDPAGSAAFALAIAASGLVFAGIGLVAAQLTPRAATALAIGASVLGVAHLVWFVADAQGVGWMLWLTPLGWSHRIGAFGDERWRIAGLSTALVVAAAWVSA